MYYRTYSILPRLADSKNSVIKGKNNIKRRTKRRFRLFICGAEKQRHWKLRILRRSCWLFTASY